MSRPVTLAALCLALSCVAPACTPAAAGPARTAHDGDSEHDDHDDLPPLPTDAATMIAAQRLTVTPSSLSCPTEIIGIVDVHANGTSEDHALAELRIRAVQLGAEALTNVEFRHGDHGDKLHLSATAVRCHDILHGRRYEVLARLDVLAPMGQEEDAFAELRARGRAAGANVILDVHFEHGDESHMRITGKAVRAYE